MLRKTDPGRTSIEEVDSFEVSHCGETYRVTLKRTCAARRFTLRVRPPFGDIVLTLPTRASLCDARSFVERHAAWIGTRLRRLPRRAGFEPGEHVPLRGVVHEIAVRRRSHGTIWIEPGGATVSGEAVPLLCVNAEPCFVPRRVRDFLVAEARRDLSDAVARYSRKFGVVPRKITLRDTRSRWGSCSSAGTLSFCWRLVMAPGFVLDYLAAHEVAHLLYMNHSTLFWAAVGRACPDSERAEAWLQAHGASLHRFALESHGKDGREVSDQAVVGAAPADAATSSRRLR
jgi:predicted metal-dependent hydrolase